MHSYDFKALNDKEFEALCVDLLSVEFGVRIERFKPGKDAGIDGRWFAKGGKETSIIQCKHWVGSGIKKLLGHLKESERPKVANLHASQYILSTSVPLSPNDKKQIVATMHPFIGMEGDVFGAEDINVLLGRHPEVEKRHYKLWLSSSETIQLLLNNAVIGRSRFELDQIRHQAPRYVVTSAHAQAARHLRDLRVLILTGEPGIGKTTLARQLVLELAASGFELVALEESISEAESVYSEDGKQIFYFDDFLGRTILEAIKPKQDSHLLRFIQRVARDPRKRFVLTSRTNILNQGVALSDLYSDVQILRSRYEVKIGMLSNLDRARLLYSHIWHSELGVEFVDELYRGKRYHKIIKHKNFNPRLVAFVVDSGKLAGLQAKDYWSFVNTTFENPSQVWRHFFSAQLSQDDRDLTYVVVLNGDKIGEAELRESFFSLLAAESANLGQVDSRFWKAVQHASGSVLSRDLVGGAYRPVYSLYNPSIADYVQAQLVESNLWAYYYSSIRTVSALSRLEQLRTQAFFGVERFRDVLRALCKSEADKHNPPDAYNIRLSRLLAVDGSLTNEAARAIERWMRIPLSSDAKVSVRDYSELLKRAIGVVDSETLVLRTTELAEFLQHSAIPLDDGPSMASILSTAKRLGAAESHDAIRSQVIAEWEEIAYEQVTESGLLSDLVDPNEFRHAKAQLREYFSSQLAELGVDLSDSEARDLCWHVDLDRIVEHNVELSGRENDESDRWRDERQDALSDDAAIDDLFDRSGRV